MRGRRGKPPPPLRRGETDSPAIAAEESVLASDELHDVCSRGRRQVRDEPVDDLLQSHGIDAHRAVDNEVD